MHLYSFPIDLFPLVIFLFTQRLEEKNIYFSQFLLRYINTIPTTRSSEIIGQYK